MNKIKLLLFSAIFFFYACDSEKEKKGSQKKGVEKSITSAKNINSYSADSFYSQLKDQLQDLSGSRNIEELLCQGWVMEDDLYDFNTMQEESKVEVPIRSLHFFPNNTFMRNIRNRVESGKWKYDADKKEISLYYDDKGGGDHYKIRAIAADELKLTDVDISYSNVYKYVADAKRYKNKMDDPFFVANNQWRVHPNRKETDQQILERVKGYIWFFILVYRDAIARESKTISFYNFPTCITWYSGGVYLKGEKELKDNWKNCFYNDAAADKAYEILSTMINKDYNWPKENINWIKKNLSVLEQMYNNL